MSERIFELIAVCPYPCQAHFKTLEEAACRLVLLADVGVGWPYTFMQLNHAMSYGPLTNEGHISAMTDSALSLDAHSQLHQLQIWKLTQHKGKVVCPEGLNGELEALQLTFPELPLWNAANPGEPFQEL